MRLLKILITLTAVAIQINAQSFGSSGSIDARTIALGGTNLTSVNGIYAIGVNPANLAINSPHKLEISTVLPLPTLNISAGNDFITLNDYQYFFTGVRGDNGELTGRFLDNSEKNKFLSLFDNGSMIHSNVGISLFSASFYPSKELGAFAFSVQDWTSVQASLPKEIFELILFGNEPGKEFNLSDLDSKAWYLRNYSLSYSRDLSEYLSDAFKFFSAGISIKMVQGFFYAGFERNNTSIATQENYNILVNGDSKMLVAASPDFGIVYDFEDEDIERESSVGLFNEPAGTGFGVDLGFYAELDESWSMAFSLTDLGSISWSEGLAEYSSNSTFLLEDITDDKLLDSLKNVVTGEGSETTSFGTSLSSAMSLGARVKLDKFLKDSFPGKLSLEFNYHQGFNNMPANSTIPRFSLGAEWIPLNWFKFRTGFSFGGYDDFNWGMGLGFDSGIIDIDLATAYLHSIFDGNNAKRLGFAMSSRWKF